jgi:hypothetical protein
MNTNEIVFCCKDFQSYIDNIGNEGFAIIPKFFEISKKNTIVFILQIRLYKNQYIHISEGAINYCPWCGCNLNEYIKIHINEMTTLATEKEILLLDKFESNRPVYMSLGNTFPFEHRAKEKD